MPALTTERLQLRPLEPEDTEALHRLWTHREVRRFLWDDTIIPHALTADIVRESQQLFQEHGFGIWGIRLLRAEPLIGFTGFWYFRDPPERELLYGLSPAHWGRGFATEAAQALIHYGFDTLGWDIIQASTDAPNEASVRVMERLGMHFERRAMINGLDTLMYRLPRPTP